MSLRIVCSHTLDGSNHAEAIHGHYSRLRGADRPPPQPGMSQLGGSRVSDPGGASAHGYGAGRDACSASPPSCVPYTVFVAARQQLYNATVHSRRRGRSQGFLTPRAMINGRSTADLCSAKTCGGGAATSAVLAIADGRMSSVLAAVSGPNITGAGIQPVEKTPIPACRRPAPFWFRSSRRPLPHLPAAGMVGPLEGRTRHGLIVANSDAGTSICRSAATSYGTAKSWPPASRKRAAVRAVFQVWLPTVPPSFAAHRSTGKAEPAAEQDAFGSNPRRHSRHTVAIHHQQSHAKMLLDVYI
jgi:hypothetical protein